jgi:hypothetical protein
MKKIFTFMSIAAIVLSACKKEPQVLTIPVLSADVTSVNAYMHGTDAILNLSWTSAGKDASYSVQITTSKDATFASGTSISVPGTKISFTGAELANIAKEIGAEDSFNMAARVRCTAEGKDAVISNIVTVATRILAVDPSIVITELYPIGEATPYGWSIDNTVAFENSNGVFTWTGHLFQNAEFKFLCSKNFWPAIVNSSSDPFEHKPVYAPADGEGIDKKFKVATEGKYTITVNAKDINAITMNVEFIDADVQEIVVNELYILGGATSTGWNLDAMEAFTKNGTIFTWTGHLTVDEFRFPLQKQSNVWWPCLMFSEDGKSIVYGKSDADKVVYKVAEEGDYTITIDATNVKNITGTIVPAS